MSEFVTRVARELAYRHRDGERFIGPDGHSYSRPHIEVWRSHAHAAIEALRYPTDAMVDAFHRSEDRGATVDASWSAMIDAALRLEPLHTSSAIGHG